MKRVISLLLAGALCVCLTACNDSTTTTSGGTEDNETTPSTTLAEGSRTEAVGSVYADKVAGFQTEEPEKGEKIAIMHTDKGDISIRFFPEAAPKAVENFLTLAEEGYYDGLTFHRVVSDFMVQGGDPTGTGTGGESMWGEAFEDEFDAKLLNLRGSLAMANSGEDSNGSQFFINQSPADVFGGRDSFSPEYREQVAKETYNGYLENYTVEELAEYGINSWRDFITETYVYEWIPDEVWTAYETYGGNLHLDGAYRRTGGHTVFGQVFDGMDVVDEIANVVTDSNNKPVVDVIIESIEVTTYAG